MLRISKAFQGGFALIFLLVMISAVVRGFIKYSPAAIAFTVVCGMVFTAGVILIYGFLKKRTVRLTRKQIDKIFIVIAAAVLVLQLISAFYLKFTPVSDLGYVDRAARDFSFFHVELSANGEGQRDLTARSDLGKFHEFSLKSYLQDKSYL